MKTLVLVRHAKSDWSTPALSDFDRPLNKRGLKDAPRMARELKDLGLLPDLILTSPANRALTTASIMSEVFAFDPERIDQIPSLYLGSPEDLEIAVTKRIGQSETLYLYAHNPGISIFASLLAERDIAMPTCCAVILTLRENKDSLDVRDLRIIRPGDLS